MDILKQYVDMFNFEDVWYTRSCLEKQGKNGCVERGKDYTLNILRSRYRRNCGR